MNKIIIGIVAFLSFNALFSQKKIEFVEYDLPNGLHVILHEEHSTPIVTVSVLYHVGSKNENPDKTGFAHFFEHLLFEGSENLKRGDYDDLVEKNGGLLNANTSQDRTYYYEVLPSNQLELGLWLESERMLHARVDKIGIETQRQVVKEEKRQRVDNQPYGSFMEEMFKRLYQVHPYRWVPIGSMEHLDAAKEEDYINFYRTFYVPSNATLCIAGDFKLEETRKWIANYFSSIPKGEAINLYRDLVNLNDTQFESKYAIMKSKFNKDALMKSKDVEALKLVKKLSTTPINIPRPEVNEPPLQKTIIDTIYDNIQLPAIMMAYRVPDQNHPDYYALDLLNTILSGSTSSRMNKNIVEKKQLAISCFSFSFGMEHPGVSLIAAIGTNGVDLSVLEKSIDEEIENLQLNLISQEEFEKIRNQYENDILTSHSTIEGIAETLADNHVYRKNTDYVNQELQKYLSVTKDEIQQVAKKYYSKDARVILYYLPKETN
ncbi:MAG: insulinase family protein [Flavobacteriia bacterium]|nr:insulinase family protein [Flavobacteriia bacterium]